MREVRIHDTLTGAPRLLEPRDPPRVGIYACGPTVYGPIHVGNARPYVVFALLKRFLEHEGNEVTLVENVTDVNDKIYDAARERGVPSAELAREMTEAYVAATDGLGLGRPDYEPKASESIDDIIALIAELKEAPQDFALWKRRKDGEDTWWDAPWGQGRPGWHIECSAMAEALLGLDFEVHGGGSDLVFPHHENEIAQTEAARGTPLARVWMHNGMVEMDAEKMAKSVGNIRLLHVALDEFGPEALVMWLVGAHYRKPVAFSEEAVADAGRAVQRIREFCRRLDPNAPEPEGLDELAERFFDALADDFNTPAARAILFDWIAEGNRRMDAGEALGRGRLGEMLYALGLEGLLEERAEEPPDAIRRLADERDAARAASDFSLADRIREQLAEQGWEVRDTPQGARLVEKA